MASNPPRTSAPSHAVSAGRSDATLSQRQLVLRRFARHRIAVVCACFLPALYLVSLFAPFFAPFPSTSRDTRFSYAPPMPPRWSLADGFHAFAVRPQIDPVTLRRDYIVDRDVRLPLGFFVRGERYRVLGLFEAERHFMGVDRDAGARRDIDPNAFRWYLLGADRFGQDVLSRLVHGSRVSLSIGLVAIAINFLVGLTLGGVSGYVGGRTDNLIQRTIEIINSFPQIPLWLAMAAVIPLHWSALQTYFAITVLLSLLTWTGLARVVRGRMLSLREEDYATAAQLIGMRHSRIIFRHLLPGMTSHIIVALTLSVPQMIIGETALSFLGLGLRPPVTSWGVMLQDCLNIEAVANYPWLLMPALAITSTVLAFNFLGDGLRDAADPYG
jgi:peptide/nickel transport system permease protein